MPQITHENGEKIHKIDKDVTLIKSDIIQIKKIMADISQYLKKTDRLEFRADWAEETIKMFTSTQNRLKKKVERTNRNVAFIVTAGAAVVAVFELFREKIL